MGNSNTSFLAAYNNCFTDDLNRNTVTPEYWETHTINEDFKNGAILTGVILLVLAIVGLPSNILVMYSIIKRNLYKEPTHMLLFNLAISDFLLCLLVMPSTIIADFSGGYIFGDSDYIRCRVCQIGFIYTWLTLFSVYTLGLLSVDRFIFIKFAMHYNKIVTVRRILLVIIVVWIMSFIVSLLPIMGFGEIRYAYSLSTCMVYFLDSTINVIYARFAVVLGLVPVMVLIGCNVWIILIVRKQIKLIYGTRKSFTTKTEYRQSIRKKMGRIKNQKQLVLLRTFGVIIITNLLVWSPLIIHAVLLLVVNDDLIPIGIFIFVYLITLLHAVLHPIIEGCLIPEIRDVFKRAFSYLFFCHCAMPHHDKIICESGKTKKVSCDGCRDFFYACSSAVLPNNSDV